MASFENRPWVTRKATEKYHVDCVDKTFEFGRETKMVWGAVTGSWHWTLVQGTQRQEGPKR